MDKNIKKISVIIATKNGGKFLPRSVASIDKQTEKNIEVIVVSDGSTDNTYEIARNLASTRPFMNVIALDKNVGPGLARNAGIARAKGNLIALLDDDDEWLDENKLKNQKKFLTEHLEHVLVGSAETEFVTDDNTSYIVKKEKNDRSIRSKILLINQFITSSVMFRKDAFEKAGGFDAMYLAEDYDLWLRLAQQGKVANIDGSLTRYSKRSSGAQQANIRKMNKIVLSLIKKYKNSYPNYWLAIAAAHARIIVR